ncbi:hypothetical protein CQW23_24780 [Capsicum baccatum]|uniref:Uncharacterized protein n=1 Tax=Capsicum baccatum TaxID=33114 RepID=A0A2G2VVR8_CAPBA|nr:hypothetical protein CQW23_24780 [Capsicum baccatum]
MEEVITEEEQQGDEVMCNEPLFPRLDELKLDDLPKLGHFIMAKSTIEVPFLKEVEIRKCPKMKTFVQQGSVSTPSLEIVNNDDEPKIVDLNNAMLNSKLNLKHDALTELNSQLRMKYIGMVIRMRLRIAGLGEKVENHRNLSA